MKMTPKRLQLIQETQRMMSKGVEIEQEPVVAQEEEVWNIPVTWMCWGMYRVSKSECSTLEEAIASVEKAPLPDQGEYIDESMRVDMEGLSIHNPSEEES